MIADVVQPLSSSSSGRAEDEPKGQPQGKIGDAKPAWRMLLPPKVKGAADAEGELVAEANVITQVVFLRDAHQLPALATPLDEAFRSD
jgi:hypothetical protein